jgi:hypothetical protein
MGGGLLAASAVKLRYKLATTIVWQATYDNPGPKVGAGPERRLGGRPTVLVTSFHKFSAEQEVRGSDAETQQRTLRSIDF